MLMRIMAPVTRQLARATPLLLIGGLAVAPGLHAQTRVGAGWGGFFEATLSFPETLLSTFRSAGSTGVSWDVVRRYGLSLAVMGQGEYTVSVVALVVAKGRITRVWTSPKRQVAAGTSTLSGRDFLPNDTFLKGVPNVRGEQAGKTLSIDYARKVVSEALNAGSAGISAEPLLGSVSSSTNGVVFVLIPDGTGKSTTTNPRFARTETMSD